jgi:hypothetical protein
VRALGNAVLAVLCTAVVGVVVITNTSPAPWWSSAQSPPATVLVTLDHLSGIGAENTYLAQTGARVRIVPVESWCGVAGRMRPGHASARGRRRLKPWVRAVVAVEAPPGNTTIVLASQHGLAGASFQVHGRGPACVPVIGAVRDW